jgi:2,4-dienoyl-CoA reductase-like NADH-dependent reductase (Old Yellow Enzyme family)
VSHLFSPLAVGPIEVPNRVVVAPMCQYSAADGCATDWHLQHLMQLAISRAGMVVLEATAVERHGRISHGCLGLYSDANEAALARVLDPARRVAAPGTRFAIQIGHAGRKASSQVPWEGRDSLRPDQSPWPTVAPSAIPFGEGWHVPHELSQKEIQDLVAAFVASAQRAKRIGFDVLELHSAHGYLLHQFLSPLSNRRGDAYGRERMKFPLEVARAVREIWPREKALGARISGNDWAEGGLGPDDAVAYARELERIGFDYVCVSSGGLMSHARLNVGPGYQVPLAHEVKKKTSLSVRAVGMFADPEQAEAIIAEGKADMVAMARAFLDNPRWVWHAAERFGVKLDYPPQYARARHDAWPGSKLARNLSKVS